jgi:DNA repair exonuclease SbcCD ATPase subunit
VTGDAIDRLYQVPLAEFTAARDALAKQAGADGAAIRKLQKPTAPAWAVNQLYWKRRKSFDRLTTAIEGVRAAHAKRLAGKTADVERAELVHAAALQAAIKEAQELLAAVGDPPTSATIIAITETLQALPWPDGPGRLTRPLRPQGFSALAGLLPKGGAAARQVAEVVELDRSRRERERTESRAERESREHAERRRERLDLDRALRAAQTAQSKTDQAVEHAREAVGRAELNRDRLSKALEQAGEALQSLREELTREQRNAREAGAEVTRLEHRLKQLNDG